MRIYIAGPYTKGDVAVNVRNSILYAEEVVRLGHIPFIPHLTHFWHMVHPHEIDFWYKQDIEWLKLCDALFRIPGDSTGSDNEAKIIQEMGKPVFYSLTDLLNYKW